jgi:hypothetical protein
MHVLRIAMGVVQKRGTVIVQPGLVTFGPAESDFLARHVVSVRGGGDGARSVFMSTSAMARLLDGMRTATDTAFVTGAESLQLRLSRTMGQATNPTDCVFAVIHGRDTHAGAPQEGHVTVLKLDAVVEAARLSIEAGAVSLHVLKELLPEPGRLQKALSWPDPRPISDVVVIDKNSQSAKYFENAFEVLVSARPADAEAELQAVIAANVPRADLGTVLTEAGRLHGPMDEVLGTLSQTRPELANAAAEAAAARRPSGFIRPNKLAARPVVWTADGVELRVPPELAGDAGYEREGDGYRLSVHVATEPVLKQ